VVDEIQNSLGNTGTPKNRNGKAIAQTIKPTNKSKNLSEFATGEVKTTENVANGLSAMKKGATIGFNQAVQLAKVNADSVQSNEVLLTPHSANGKCSAT
jgi:hypothetical protein